MSFLKLTVGLLVMAVTAKTANSTVANYLADRAVVRMQNWIRVGGREWLSLPGHIEQGLNSTNTGFYTLAIAAPKFQSLYALIRTEDAHMTGESAEYPLYITNQDLNFELALKNVTVNYDQIRYTDYKGLTNLSASVTTGGIKINLTISIAGEGSRCIATAVKVLHTFKAGDEDIFNKNYMSKEYSIVDIALAQHFEKNILQAIEVLIYAAAVNIFDRYDICRDNKMSQSEFLTLKSLSARGMGFQLQ